MTIKKTLKAIMENCGKTKQNKTKLYYFVITMACASVFAYDGLLAMEIRSKRSYTAEVTQ